MELAVVLAAFAARLAGPHHGDLGSPCAHKLRGTTRGIERVLNVKPYGWKCCAVAMPTRVTTDKSGEDARCEASGTNFDTTSGINYSTLLSNNRDEVSIVRHRGDTVEASIRMSHCLARILLQIAVLRLHCYTNGKRLDHFHEFRMRHQRHVDKDQIVDPICILTFLPLPAVSSSYRVVTVVPDLSYLVENALQIPVQPLVAAPMDNMSSVLDTVRSNGLRHTRRGLTGR